MTKIEWTDATWNPVIGCSKVSPGCQNCYAVTMSRRVEAMGNPDYIDLTTKHPNGLLDWSGQVKCLADRLQQPLQWKKPRRIFVNSMSDLFHPEVPFEFIDKVFAIMAICPQHTFQILTKRPERMREYFSNINSRVCLVGIWAEHYSGMDRYIWGEPGGDYYFPRWPLPFSNVWLGTSIEDQKTADERIPHLLSCPEAIHFVSAEPLLGEVLLRYDYLPRMESLGNTLDWVIVGGESGQKARPMHPDWARGLRDQCKVAGVPFFFKQWGEWEPSWGGGDHLLYPDGKFVDGSHEHTDAWKGKIAEPMRRVGKAHAGRKLDGQIHDEYPNTKASA